jgi:hypothetical protein
MSGLAKIERVCAWYRAQLVSYSDMESVFLYLGVLLLWLVWFAWVTIGYLLFFGWIAVIFHEVFHVEIPIVYIGMFIMIVISWISHVVKVLSL